MEFNQPHKLRPLLGIQLVIILLREEEERGGGGRRKGLRYLNYYMLSAQGFG